MSGPLEGVKVVELGFWVAGPAAACVLGEWGADVIKVESPSGDPGRGHGKTILGDHPHNPYFDPLNRGKRSIVINMKETDGKDAMMALLGQADIFVTNLRTAALERMGLSYDGLKDRFPSLIYGLVTGYGLEGPDAGQGSYDLGAYWSRGGLASMLMQNGGDPQIQPRAMGDIATALTLSGMLGTALYYKEKTGKGQLVSISLLRYAAWQVSGDINSKSMLNVDPQVTPRRDVPNPLWNNYKSSDNKRFWLIGNEADRHWPQLARIVERPQWLTDPRYKNRVSRAAISPEIIGELDEIFESRPMSFWRERFGSEQDFFWSPINTIDDLLEDPQFLASGAMMEMPSHTGGPTQVVAPPGEFHATPRAPTTAPPMLGQHTGEILAELGLAPSKG